MEVGFDGIAPKRPRRISDMCIYWQFPLAKVHMQNLVNLLEFRNLVLLCFRELSCDTVSTVLANARKQG